MKISAQQVKEIRQRTGAKMMGCKRALEEAQGDQDAAVDILRRKGLSGSEERSQQATSNGTVAIYVHAGNKIGAMVELCCETDFVARTPEFQGLAQGLAQHAAVSPAVYVNREDVPPGVLEASLDEIPSTTADAKRQRDEWYSLNVLSEQPYISSMQHQPVSDIIKELSSSTGENIVLRRFCRMIVGA